MPSRKITKAYVRHYSDNGQTTAYVEWLDDTGHCSRIEGELTSFQMVELLKLAKSEGIRIGWEQW